MVNDPIADLLTRIRNVIQRSRKTVEVPSSKMTTAILSIMKNEGYIEDYKESEENVRSFVVELKYVNGKSAISHLKRVSKPGLRIYSNYKDIPIVLRGLGISIFSTPMGVITGKKARELKTGGEYLCEIW
jgi:small subunit ribosomal protein S8